MPERKHLEEQHRSKVSDVEDADNYENGLFKRALAAPVLAPYHQGNGLKRPTNILFQLLLLSILDRLELVQNISTQNII